MSTLKGIPIEKDYGAGTSLSHWDEGNLPSGALENRYYNGQYCPSLKYEVMTGFTNANDFLTRVTAGALKDYGYPINLNSQYIVGYPSDLVPVVAGAVGAVGLGAAARLRCECIMEDGMCKHVMRVDNSREFTNSLLFWPWPAYPRYMYKHRYIPYYKYYYPHHKYYYPYHHGYIHQIGGAPRNNVLTDDSYMCSSFTLSYTAVSSIGPFYARACSTIGAQ